MEMQMETKPKANQLNDKKETSLQLLEDTPPCGGGFGRMAGENNVVVDVPLDWPTREEVITPYTPPPEDFEKVIEASLGVPVEKLGVLAKMEVERIYFDGLCGRARGYTKKIIPFKNWVAYVIKSLWTAYNKGLLRGCRKPRTVIVKA